MGVSILALAAGVGLLADSFLQRYKAADMENELERAASQASVQAPEAGPGLEKLIRSIGRATGFRFTVIARDGTVLADSSADAGAMDNHAARPEVAVALQGRRGVEKRKSSTLGVETLYVAIPTGPVIRAARPFSDVEELTEGMRARLLLAVAISLIAAMALSYILARPLTGRLAAMKSFSSAMAGGDYDRPFDSSGPGELGGLERSLETLRGGLRTLVLHLSGDRAKLASIIDGMPDAALLFSAGGRLTAANKAAKRLLRLPASGWEGLSKEEVAREPEILTALDAVMTSDNPPEEPVRLGWRGPELELEVICRPMKEEKGGRGALLLMRDVSRQARLERIRTDFIANMAHELLTPLTAIRGAAETLVNSRQGHDEQTARFIATIHRHSIRLGNIVADVSQLSMIESGALPVETARIDARRPADEVAALFAPEAEKTGLSLKTAAPQEPAWIVSDAEKIESILVNLVQNSIRYTPSGGSVTITVKSIPNGAVYEVADTGVGIPYKDLPRVTERFYRVDPGRSREKGGTGLGLSIVKRLVMALGGKLSIDSQLGKGTRVKVELPFLPQPEK